MCFCWFPWTLYLKDGLGVSVMLRFLGFSCTVTELCREVWANLQEDLLSLTVSNTNKLLSFQTFFFPPGFLPCLSSTPIHQPALPIIRTAISWGRAYTWYVWEASQPQPSAHAVQFNTPREALSTPFCIHELMPMIGWCHWDWWGERITPLLGTTSFAPLAHSHSWLYIFSLTCWYIWSMVYSFLHYPELSLTSCWEWWSGI